MTGTFVCILDAQVASGDHQELNVRERRLLGVCFWGLLDWASMLLARTCVLSPCQDRQVSMAWNNKNLVHNGAYLLCFCVSSKLW